MTNVISVITAAHAPSARYLAEAYASLAAQQLPDGWAWQWLVQEDGETGEIARVLSDDPRISYGSARPGGPGVARTMALARAVGSLVKNFDADDQLTDGALARDIEALTRNPDIGWTTSRVLDLLPDGSTVSWEHADPPEGIFPRDSVLNFWQEHNWLLPVHPVTLCIRRDLLLALGGWMALTTTEDTGLLIAANTVSDGYFIAEPSLLYRKHPEQITAQAYHVEPTERDARRLMIVARAEALRALLDGPAVRHGASNEQHRRVA